MTPEEEAGWAQLAELRDLTLMTGGLHNLQVTLLYGWVDCCMPYAEKFTLGFDPERRILEFDSKKKPLYQKAKSWMSKKLPVNELYDGFDRSVKELLGKDVEVRLRTEGKIVYSSVGQESKKRAHSPRV